MVFIFLKQTRIRSCSYFASAIPGTPVYIRVSDINRFSDQLKAFGFRDSDENGTSILPCGINRYAKMNAEPYFTVNRQLPKEEYSQTVYWTRYEWAGRGQLNPVTDFSFITKKRYHRDYFPPHAVNFTLVKGENTSYIVSDPIPYSDSNHAKLLNTINMVLGVFGECYVDFSEDITDIKRVVVNWDILPQGECPWPAVKETLGKLTKDQTRTQTELMLRNCEAIYEKNPDFVAYGRAGFRGYAVFGFTKNNLYILESALPNNATYVLQDDWESISKLTKAEILSQGLHKARIIHSESWQKSFDAIMEDING